MIGDSSHQSVVTILSRKVKRRESKLIKKKKKNAEGLHGSLMKLHMSRFELKEKRRESKLIKHKIEPVKGLHGSLVKLHCIINV